MKPTTSARISCSFCDLVIREPLIHRSEGALAVPSVGAFIEGWTLVVPDDHVQATSELLTTRRQLFDDALVTVRKRVECIYGPVVLFEHGSAGVGRTAGCGVDHAHVHVVPGEFDLRSAIADVSREVGAFRWTRSERPWGVGESRDYIWLADATGSWLSYADVLPSQVVRRALAARLGVDVWDWKRDRRANIVRATTERLGASPVPSVHAS